MKNFTEYAIFVMQAYLAGCQIETAWYSHAENKWVDVWEICIDDIKWNWENVKYRIKLPEGWEYLIEDGDIAFRYPENNEWCLDNNYVPYQTKTGTTCINQPIIKRKEVK